MVKKILFFVLIIFILCACGQEDKKEEPSSTNPPASSLEDERTLISLDEKDGVELLTSGNTLPKGFDKMALRREYPPHFNYLVYKAENQQEYKEVFDLYFHRDSLQEVNFDEKDVLFLGINESGSCPYDLKWVENKPELPSISFELTLPAETGVCTDDATPKTFVLKVSNEISSQNENVLIIQSGSETVVPITKLD